MKTLPVVPLLAFLLVLAVPPVLAISPEAMEFIEVSRKLEPVHCQKRKITRELAVAEVEKDAVRVRELRAQFEKLSRDKQTAALEKRLMQLESRIVGKDGRARRAEDLDAINMQRGEAFYRCV